MAETVTIRSYADEYLADLVRLYNEHMTHLPYAWPITSEEFRRGVIEMAAPNGHELPFDAEGLKIAFRSETPAGYAHAAELPPPRRFALLTMGAIYFLCVAPGDTEAARALIAACSEHLRSRGLRCDEIWPVEYSHWFFQGGKGKISEQSHIAETLLRCGWRPFRKEHVMVLRLDTPRPVARPRIQVEVRQTETRNRYTDRRVEAWVGERSAGWVSWRTMSQMSNHPDAAKVGYVGGVATEPQFRRNRISSHLMGLVAEDMRRQRLTQAWLMARVNNQPAVALYTSLGWRSATVTSAFAPPKL